MTSSSSVAASITKSASPKASSEACIGDAGESLVAVGLGDFPAMHLTAQIAVDGRDRGLDPLLADIIQEHIISGKRIRHGRCRCPFAPRR